MERDSSVGEGEDIFKRLVSGGQNLESGLDGVINRFAAGFEDAFGQKAVAEADPAFAADSPFLRGGEDLLAGIIAVVGDEFAVGDGGGRHGSDLFIGRDTDQLVHRRVLGGRKRAYRFIPGVPDIERLAVGQDMLFPAGGRQDSAHARVRAPKLGGCLGYLIWNWYPGKVMMGDTGSMFLGGMVVALAYAIDCPLIILLYGIIYVVEMFSDVLQICYFKATHGKRIFKMAPIHHHFEMCGWKERKICVVFTLVQLFGGIIGTALLYYGMK